MTLSTQFITMLSMIIMGSIFGATFDTYSRLFNRSNRHSIIVFLNDVTFWLLQGLLVFYLLLKINNGEIRFYIFLSLLCGFAAYQSLFKSSYLYLLERIIYIAIKSYRTISYVSKTIVIRPVYTIILLISSLVITIFKGLLTLVKYVLNGLLFILNTFFTIVFYPIKLIGMFFYKRLLPKSVTNFMQTVYNKVYNVKIRIKSYLKNTFKNK